MRRLAIVVLAGGFLAAAGASGAFAQDQGGGDPGGGGGQPSLRPTEDQQNKLQDIRDKMQEQVLPLRIKERKALRKLRDQVRKKASDSDIAATLDELKSVHDSMRDAQEKSEQEMAKVLTPTQRAMMVLKMTGRA
ncbi:MAG: Spy/CpxP family protein refolding chaperone, partial [Elusimicrobia bacterium]|nr:Spy/CpxP family protein refolding chaperone [Elusimicrobiota bacterium]